MCYPQSSSFPDPSPEVRAVWARFYLKSCLDILQGAEDSGGSRNRGCLFTSQGRWLADVEEVVSVSLTLTHLGRTGCWWRVLKLPFQQGTSSLGSAASSIKGSDWHSPHGLRATSVVGQNIIHVLILSSWSFPTPFELWGLRSEDDEREEWAQTTAGERSSGAFRRAAWSNGEGRWWDLKQAF